MSSTCSRTRDTPKIVFSKTLDKVEWNARLVRDDIAEEIRNLKDQPGKYLWLHGGPGLASTFMRLGLIDEFRVYVKPVVLGGGKPMFPRSMKLNLRLVDTRTFGCGVVLLRYVLV